MTKAEGMKRLEELEKDGNIGNTYVLYKDEDGDYSISEFTDGLSYCPGLEEVARVQCSGD